MKKAKTLGSIPLKSPSKKIYLISGLASSRMPCGRTVTTARHRADVLFVMRRNHSGEVFIEGLGISSWKSSKCNRLC